jgi:ribosomal-protein-alanine N-acetyltransferase
MYPILETERFFLRKLEESDLEGFFELDSDPEVHRYLGNEPVSDRKKLMDVIHYVQQQYIDNGIGRWAIIDKQNGDFIGWCGLKFVEYMVNGRTGYYDLGYRLIRKHWGKGVATETARASINYGFEVMGLEEIIGAIHRDNVASRNVVHKLGFTLKEEFDFESEPHCWYVLKKENWIK